MATRQQVIERCVELGATLHDDRDPNGRVSVFAPHRKVFESDQHEAFVDLNPSWKRASVYAYLMEELAGGVKPCEVDGCEWCGDGPALPYGIEARHCPVIDGIKS